MKEGKRMGQQPPNKLDGTTGDPSAEIAASDSRFYLGAVSDGGGKPAANLAYLTFGSAHGENSGDCEIEISGGRCHEAAALIEAAPDMLAALNAVIECDESLDLHAYDYLHHYDDVRVAIATVQAAIAKATGERSPVVRDPSNAEAVVQSASTQPAILPQEREGE